MDEFEKIIDNLAREKVNKKKFEKLLNERLKEIKTDIIKEASR